MKHTNSILDLAGFIVLTMTLDLLHREHDGIEPIEKRNRMINPSFQINQVK